MGETVLFYSKLSMNRIVICFIIFISVAKYTGVSADLEFYPDYQSPAEEEPQPQRPWGNAEQLLLEGLQKLLTQQRMQQLRIQAADDNQPRFTFQLPEREPSDQDNFAVPPSDPRYYKEGPNIQIPVKEEEKQEVVTQEVQTPQLQTADHLNIIQSEPQVYKTQIAQYIDENDVFFIAIVAGCSAAAVAGVLVLSYAWYRFHKNTKAAADVEYPAYGVTGPNKEVTPTGDRRLAQSAQMYHYQHQKQQIIAMESSRGTNERRTSMSEADSEEENEEGDYTVYECPGLATTGEMEVRNPMFQDDPTPAATKEGEEDQKEVLSENLPGHPPK